MHVRIQAIIQLLPYRLHRVVRHPSNAASSWFCCSLAILSLRHHPIGPIIALHKFLCGPKVAPTVQLSGNHMFVCSYAASVRCTS